MKYAFAGATPAILIDSRGVHVFSVRAAEDKIEYRSIVFDG